jgi:OmcA/MtrC family decaheme c-type cytochrome
MRITTRRAVGAALIGVALVSSCGGGGGGDDQPTPTPTVVPTPSGPAGAGVTAEIVAATIAADPAGQVDVTFTLTDAAGTPITPTSQSAEDDQHARVRLTIARLEEYSGGGDLANDFLRYVNEVNATQPAYDQGGTFELLDPERGLYRYTFTTQVVPASPDQTYSVGMQVDRDFAGVEESANPVFDFVPGGGTPRVYADTTTAQCNVCHAPLVFHGNRREVRLCNLCHTEAAVDDDGVTIDFRSMIHMIHAGKELPSIVDGPPGSQYVVGGNVFAEKDADGTITGVGFPRPIEECASCHAEGPTAEFYRTKPSAAACATCHDDVNPSEQTTKAGPPGTNHPPGAYADGQCTACHHEDASSEFDISVPGAHVVPAQSSMLAGLNLSIDDVRDVGAGQMPTIVFTLRNDAGDALRDLSGLSNLSFNLAGPTTDYEQRFTASPIGDDPDGTLTGPDGEGAFTFALSEPIPADAVGSWSVGAEARRSVRLTDSISVNEAAPNPVVSFSVDGGEASPRRVVVEDQNCFSCHGEFSKGFSVHGNLRNRVEYCALCHNPNESDANRRRNDPAAVAAASPVATIDFKVMIHKIHRGDDLAEPYAVYGFNSMPVSFNDLRFSGDLRICTECHAEGTAYLPPFPGTALGTLFGHLDPQNGDEIIDGRLGPVTSVCTSCHDDPEATAHAEAETTADGEETCTVCHSEDRPFATSALHAGRN